MPRRFSWISRDHSLWPLCPQPDSPSPSPSPLRSCRTSSVFRYDDSYEQRRRRLCCCSPSLKGEGRRGSPTRTTTKRTPKRIRIHFLLRSLRAQPYIMSALREEGKNSYSLWDPAVSVFYFSKQGGCGLCGDIIYGWSVIAGAAAIVSGDQGERKGGEWRGENERGREESRHMLSFFF